MPWPQTVETQYHAQLRLPYKGRAIKVLAAFNIWDLEPLDLLNGLALGCYQPSPEVLIVLNYFRKLQSKFKNDRIIITSLYKCSLCLK